MIAHPQLRILLIPSQGSLPDLFLLLVAALDRIGHLKMTGNDKNIGPADIAGCTAHVRFWPNADIGPFRYAGLSLYDGWF
jgi:hypothetical protein